MGGPAGAASTCSGRHPWRRGSHAFQTPLPPRCVPDGALLLLLLPPLPPPGSCAGRRGCLPQVQERQRLRQLPGWLLPGPRRLCPGPVPAGQRPQQVCLMRPLPGEAASGAARVQRGAQGAAPASMHALHAGALSAVTDCTSAARASTALESLQRCSDALSPLPPPSCPSRTASAAHWAARSARQAPFRWS
jgi:hypothetical protein